MISSPDTISKVADLKLTRISTAKKASTPIMTPWYIPVYAKGGSIDTTNGINRQIPKATSRVNISQMNLIFELGLITNEALIFMKYYY